MRLGDLDELKEDLTKWFPQFTLEGIEAKTLFNQILHDIDNAPTVDMNTELSVAYLKGRRQGQSDERPQGEWLCDDLYLDCRCSICNSYALERGDYPELSKYCPHCGAKMTIKENKNNGT